MTTVVLIHGGKSTGEKLQEALPGADVYVVYRAGLSEQYDERVGIAHEYPTLEAFMEEFAPSWRRGDPLVLLGFSAGAWALRYYLRDPDARDAIAAAIFLDGLYGAADGSSLHKAYEGVLEFGRMAQADPDNKRLVMTYSAAHPGPGTYSNLIAREVDGGEGPGVFVRGYSNADHGAQQGIVGPAVVRELIAGWIEGVRSGGIGFWGWIVGLAATVGLGGWLLGRRRRRHRGVA